MLRIYDRLVKSKWKKVYVLQQHLIFATCYYLLLTIIFYDAAAISSLNILMNIFIWYVSEDSKISKKKILKKNVNKVFSEKIILLRFFFILRIIWNVCMQKKSDFFTYVSIRKLLIFCDNIFLVTFGEEGRGRVCIQFSICLIPIKTWC